MFLGVFKTIFFVLIFLLVNVHYYLNAQPDLDGERMIRLLETYSSAPYPEKMRISSKMKQSANNYLPTLLEIALTSPDNNLRENAKRIIVSLEEASKEAAKSLFLRAMDDDNSDIRERARDILGAIGKEAEPILENLKKTLEGFVGIKQQRAFRILSAMLWEPHFNSYLPGLPNFQISQTADNELAWFGIIRQEAESIIRKGLNNSNENIRDESIFALHENPHMVGRMLPELVGALQKSKDTNDGRSLYNYNAAISILQSRDYLTDAEETTLGELLTSAGMGRRKTPKETCSHVCQYASNYLSELQNRISTEASDELVALPSLFIVKAYSFCPQLKEPVENYLKDFLNKSSSDISRSCLSEPNPFKNLREHMGEVLKVIGLWSDNPLHEKKFYILFLQELLKLNFITQDQRENITQELNKATASIKASYEAAISGRGLRGSLFGTYSVSTMLLAVKEEHALATLQKSRNPEYPLLFPYDQNGPDPILEQNPSASIGRTIPAYLALYKHEHNDQRKKEYLRDLKAAVKFYMKEWPFSYLRLGLDESVRTNIPVRAHIRNRWPSDQQDRLGPDSFHMAPYGIAPYYIYPSLPYVSSALHLLFEETKDEDEKKEIRELKNTLHQQLSSLMGSKGMMVNEKDPYHKSYEQLAAFALLPLAEECSSQNNPTSLYGIVNFE